ncbi:hypothetical protein NQ314_014890 [Rhamnusium bicolor]|uniref:Flavin-containing monooxygenase n=1 Tax=Rhamnusium bicolor TaxID=1586634 RepID=A0AAV8WZH3_9CUCU|nr:hypothetical protein NQ314_014890 [Rhamnusium bicolor]
MAYEDFPYREPQISYISQPEVLTYINNYASSFNLLPHIKFFKHVVQIDPLPDGKWTVKIKDLKTNNSEQNEYDAVLVCVGKYSVPKSPRIQGMDKFKGTIIHSHAFRKPDPFKNRKVLIVGAGPSGIDISRIVSEVFISIRSENSAVIKPSDTVSVKTDIKEIEENSVIFKDNSKENIDDIIFCTGYQYSYPFLSSRCGISIDNNWVKYLYKQIINIEHPTMGFIGIPFRICPFPIFWYTGEIFSCILKGNVKINKEQMLQELNQYMLKKKEEGSPPQHAHLLGLKQGWYTDDLGATAGIKKVPPVIAKLYEYIVTSAKGKFHISYKIVNDNEFIQMS